MKLVLIFVLTISNIFNIGIVSNAGIIGKKECVWPRGKILQVKFMHPPDTPLSQDEFHETKNRVQEAALEWTKETPVRFNFIESGDADIRVMFRKKGSASEMGACANLDQNHETMNLDIGPATPEKTFQSTVWHEFGHALGLDHEMQHPESDIAWNVTRLYEGYGYKNKDFVDAQILEKMKDTNLKTTYDSSSIMHYPVPAHDTLDGRVVNENFKISRLDKELIRNVYRIKPQIKIDESGICHHLSET
ncbi:MAG: M12 family metallopeptidase, partial [Bdellovibrionia bacterium]